MAFKCMTGLSPKYLSNKFISRGSISGRATCDSQKLNIPLWKSATGQRSFHYRIVSIWNAISPTLKLSQSVSSFKCSLKLDLLKKFLPYIRELTNRRLLHHGAVRLCDMLTAHAFLSTCQLRAKVDDVGESDLPAYWKQEDVRLVFKVFSRCFGVFLPDNLSMTLGACP